MKTRKTLLFVLFVIALLNLSCSSSNTCDDTTCDGDATTDGDGTTENDTTSDGDLVDSDIEKDVESVDAEEEQVESDAIDKDAESNEGDVIEKDTEKDAESVDVETDQEGGEADLTELDSDAELSSCVGSCTQSTTDNLTYCPSLIDNSLCRCDPGQSKWTLFDCTTYCTGEGFSGSEGCGFAIVGDGFDCLCTRDCTDSVAVQTDCDNPAGPIYTNCTCGSADPCNWISNDFCDQSMCSLQYSSVFDDSADCDDDCSNPTAVQAMCDGSTMNNCTCAATDPCGWAASNGTCDDMCATLFPADHFVDADCK